MKTTIYVMTHKKAPMPSNEIYHPIHVGKALGSDLGYPGDDTGDNISDLNPLFGELTGIYWIWKNDSDSDAIGINHYRRYFMNSDDKLMTAEEYRDILNEYDLITTDLSAMPDSNYDSYSKAHNIADFEQIGASINRLCPEYSEAYKWYGEQHGGYYGNLTVMPRSMFMDYCEWMFGILFDASDYIDVSGYDLYHRRVYGFLSELLLNIWVHHNRLRPYECDIMFTAEKAETVELKKALSVLVGEHRIKEARQMYYEITKIRPDVLLPESDISGELLIIEQILYILEKEEEQGITGLYSFSDNLSELLSYYKSESAAHLEGKENGLSLIATELVERLSNKA